MEHSEVIHGFSALNRQEKIRHTASFADHPQDFFILMEKFWKSDPLIGNPLSDISENVISGYCLPYSIAPNFLINGKHYMVPMVTEESSVVAAASAAAKYWFSRGGFHCQVAGMIKPGNIHFLWKNSKQKISRFIEDISAGLRESAGMTENAMRARGGGIQDVILHDLNHLQKGYFRLEILFDTVDAMGANFINTCLEEMAQYITKRAAEQGISEDLEIIMAILSNYTPECLVACKISCALDDLNENSALNGREFARRFEMAVNIASADFPRAVTHNKGIMNGIDAVLIATGNDYRAVEAGIHAWASRNNSYQGLSKAEVNLKEFTLSMEVPLPVGVVGGLTKTHPMAKASLDLLGNPDARLLMMIAASAGLACNFSAIRALITQGIQKGHMKMHLSNLLNQVEATPEEKEKAMAFFKDRAINILAVREFISNQRL